MSLVSKLSCELFFIQRGERIQGYWQSPKSWRCSIWNPNCLITNWWKEAKRKNILTPPQHATNTPTNAIGVPYTQVDMETSIISQQVPHLVRQNMDLHMKVMLEIVPDFNIIHTPSHPLLLKTHKFVRQIIIYPTLHFWFTLSFLIDL